MIIAHKDGTGDYSSNQKPLRMQDCACSAADFSRLVIVPAFKKGLEKLDILLRKLEKKEKRQADINKRIL